MFMLGDVLSGSKEARDTLRRGVKLWSADSRHPSHLAALGDDAKLARIRLARADILDALLPDGQVVRIDQPASGARVIQRGQIMLIVTGDSAVGLRRHPFADDGPIGLETMGV